VPGSTSWCDSETWAFNKKYENYLNTFERKILRRSLGQIIEKPILETQIQSEIYECLKNLAHQQPIAID
jgi:hypothetical protein